MSEYTIRTAAMNLKGGDVVMAREPGTYQVKAMEVFDASPAGFGTTEVQLIDPRDGSIVRTVVRNDTTFQRVN